MTDANEPATADRRPSGADPTSPSGRAWVATFAEQLGLDPPTAADMEALLDLAGVAAHASERLAAPLACYLVGRAGLTPADALDLARALAGEGDS